MREYFNKFMIESGFGEYYDEMNGWCNIPVSEFKGELLEKSLQLLKDAEDDLGVHLGIEYVEKESCYYRIREIEYWRY